MVAHRLALAGIRLLLVVGCLTCPATGNNQFAVFDTDYGIGGTAGDFSVEVNGQGFDRTVAVALTCNPDYRLEAGQYYRGGSDVLYATFDLTRTHAGDYDVVVNKTSTGESAVVISGLRVVAGGGGAVELAVMGLPDDNALAAEHEVPFAFQVVCENPGNNDAYAPVIEFQTNRAFFETMEAFWDDANGDLATTFDIWYPSSGIGGALPGILRPRQTYCCDYWMGPIELDSSGEPVEELNHVLSGMYDDPEPFFNWMAYFDWHEAVTETNQFQVLEQLYRQVDTTDSGLLAMFSRNARLLTREQWDSDLAYYHLIRLEIDKALAAVTTSISGHIQADSFEIPISGIRLRARNLDSDDLHETTSLFDGSFRFHGLSGGDYEISTEVVLAQEGGVLAQLEAGQHLQSVEVPVANGNCVDLSVRLAGQQRELPEGATVFLSWACESGCGDHASSDDPPTFKQLWEFHESHALHITGLPDGQYGAVVHVPGFAETYASFTVQEADAETREITVDCVAGVSVRGSVPDDLEEALDRSGVLQGTEDGNYRRILFADWDRSAFVFQNVMPGRYRLSLRTPGYAAVFKTVDVSSNGCSVELGEFELSPERTLTVKWIGDFSDQEEDAVAVVIDSNSNPVTSIPIQVGTDFVLAQMNGQEYDIGILNGERVLYQTVVDLGDSLESEWSIFPTDASNANRGQDIQVISFAEASKDSASYCGWLVPISLAPITSKVTRGTCPACTSHLQTIIRHTARLEVLKKDYDNTKSKHKEASMEFRAACGVWLYCIHKNPLPEDPSGTSLDPCSYLKREVDAKREKANDLAHQANSIAGKSHWISEYQLKAAGRLLAGCEKRGCEERGCSEGSFPNPLPEEAECITCHQIDDIIRDMLLDFLAKQTIINDMIEAGGTMEAIMMANALAAQNTEYINALARAFQDGECAQTLGVSFLDLLASLENGMD